MDLRVNFIKSKLSGIGISDDQLHRYVTFLNFSFFFLSANPKLLLNEHIFVLGIMIGKNPRQCKNVGYCNKKIKKKLTRWKGKLPYFFSSRSGLIKSVLSVIPLYHISLFKAQNRVINEIHKIQRKIFWG